MRLEMFRSTFRILDLVVSLVFTPVINQWIYCCLTFIKRRDPEFIWLEPLQLGGRRRLLASHAFGSCQPQHQHVKENTPEIHTS